jgi:hypothetical protein
MEVQKERLADLGAQKHYELLMVEVGIRLTDFPTAKVAVTAIRDAIVGAPDSRRCFDENLTRRCSMRSGLEQGQHHALRH